MYDEEVGYCQGLSFLSAVLLLHVSKTILEALLNLFKSDFDVSIK